MIEVLAGVAALGYAVGVASGRTQPPSHGDRAADRSRIVRRLRNPSVTTASLAGVATHLPGLFYVVALNAIVAEGRGLLAGVLYVLLFNATTLVFTAAGAYLAIKGTTGLAG